MDIIKIIAIAPYDGMAQLIKSISKHRVDVKVDVFVANLEDGIEIVENNYREYDVLVSRGGTAHLLEKLVDIPVVEISFTTLDILSAIDKAKKTNTEYVIVGYPNLANTAKSLCSVINDDTEIYTTYNSESVETTLELLKLKKTQLILADTVNHEKSSEFELDSILVVSGEESINISLNHAVKIGKMHRKQRLEKELLKLSNNLDEYETYVYDNHLNLLITNSNEPSEIASKILKDNQHLMDFDIMYQDFVLGNDFGVKYKFITTKISGAQYFIIKTKKINTLHPISHIRLIDKKQALETYLDSFYNLTSSIGDLKDDIKLASDTNKIVIIAGELGTGKTEVANRIYSLSKFSHNPMYIIDYPAMQDEEREMFLNNENSPLYDLESTFNIIIDSKVPKKYIQKLFSVLDNGRICMNNKCIISLKLEYNASLDSEIIKIWENPDVISIFLDPLREHIDDIINLSTLFIDEQNSISGKNIIGFEDDVYNVFNNYSWPQNFIQLWRVLYELFYTTTGEYIEKTNICKIIEKEKKLIKVDGSTDDEFTKLINIDNTLEDLIINIVNEVLVINNGNRTKTAKSLGISRSTLWRYLSSEK